MLRAPKSRRSPFFGRLDLRFVSNFVLQHPAMVDDDGDDDDVDDTFPISLRLRDLLRQIADTITACPGMRADVSTLRAMARSRTTCIDEDVIVSVLVLTMREMAAAYRRSQRRHHRFRGPFSAGRSTSSSHRDDDPPPDRSSLHPPSHRHPSPPHRIQLFRASGRRTTTIADSTTTRVGHFVLGGGVRRGHDPRRPENRSLTFFRRRSPSSEGE